MPTQPNKAHTPGPWLLVTVPTSVGSCHKIGPFPNGDRVQTFACVYADGHRKGIDDASPAAQELAANARLIAAAPELLAFAQEFLDDYKSEDGMNSMKYYAGKAHELIARATGASREQS